MEYVSRAIAGLSPAAVAEGSGAASIADTLYAQVLEANAQHSGSQPAPDAQHSGSQSAPALVFLHPTPLHHAFWLPVAERLPGYRRVLPDLRGHGRSPLGAAPSHPDPQAPALTIQQLAADTLALLDALSIKHAIFIGCSIGGYTLYELWRTAPERVAGLVFCASKPQADTDAERAKRAEWIAKMEPARLQESNGSTPKFIDVRVPHVSPLRHGFQPDGSMSPTPEFIDAMLTALLSQSTHRDHPALVAEVRNMMVQVRPEAIQAIQRGLAQRPDARQTAQTIHIPTCVIAGAEDASSTPADLSALHATLLKAGSRSTYHQLSNAGHYGPIEQPAQVAAILDTFCHSLA